MKSVTAEKVTTLEEQREGEVVAEEEVVKVEAGGGGDESGRACGAQGRGVGEGRGQRRWRRKTAKTPSYRSGFEKLGKMAKNCAVAKAQPKREIDFLLEGIDFYTSINGKELNQQVDQP